MSGDQSMKEAIRIIQRLVTEPLPDDVKERIDKLLAIEESNTEQQPVGAAIIKGEGTKSFARRAIFDTFPIEDEEVVINEGNLAITTRRPKFWTEGVHSIEKDDLTYGDALNALIIQCARKYDEEREANEEALAEIREVEEERDIWKKKLAEAKKAYNEGEKSKEDYDVMLGLEEAVEKAESKWRMVRHQKSRLVNAKKKVFRPVISFMEQIAITQFDFDFEFEYGEDR